MKAKPTPKPGAERKRVKIAVRQWESGEPREVDLVEQQHSDRHWEVYLPDGTWIGTVGRYTGSLDRKYKGSRLRHPGKTRTLWSSRLPRDGARTYHGEVSRADAIRDLIDWHKRKNT